MFDEHLAFNLLMNRDTMSPIILEFATACVYGG